MFDHRLETISPEVKCPDAASPVGQNRAGADLEIAPNDARKPSSSAHEPQPGDRCDDRSLYELTHARV